MKEKKKRAGRPPKPQPSGRGKHPGQPGRPPKVERKVSKPYMLLTIENGGSELQILRFQYVDEAREKMKRKVRAVHKFSEEIFEEEQHMEPMWGFDLSHAYSILYDETNDEYTYRFWYLLDTRKAGLE